MALEELSGVAYALGADNSVAVNLYGPGSARQIKPNDWPYFGSMVKMLKPSERLPALTSVWARAAQDSMSRPCKRPA